MRKWWVIGGSVAVLGILVFAGFMWEQKKDILPTLTMNDKVFSAIVLRTDEELQRGLSGTKNLPDDQAMLFVFPYTINSCGIWMKDMNYAIDIIWLDKDKKIVHLVEDAQPSSYKSVDDAKIFGETQSCHYVIETISGTIKKAGIKIGDTVQLPAGVQ